MPTNENEDTQKKKKTIPGLRRFAIGLGLIDSANYNEPERDWSLAAREIAS